MLRTRLWMGALLIALAGLVLLEGHGLAPWFPFLLFTTLLATLFGTRELLLLVDPQVRPVAWVTYLGVGLILFGNWCRAVSTTIDPWHGIGAIFVVCVLLTFLREMFVFRGPNQIIPRIALTVFAFVYLGLLPSFLIQLRWWEGSFPNGISPAALSFAMTIFVPKCGDIGAYFTGKFLTGRLLGRHPMTPLLSPKKTWQGFVGGMLASVGTAISLNQLGPVLSGGLLHEIGFGLTVGLAGVFGDLAESLIKRDGNQKDASKTIPGFGGILDVIDSLLFAAPMAYLWFSLSSIFART